MEKLSDEQLIELLNAKYEGANREYVSQGAKLTLAERELNKCIVALNLWSKDQIPLVGNLVGNNGSVEPTKTKSEKEDTPLVYDSGASVRDKIVRVLKLENRAMTKVEIADYIGLQENKTDETSIEDIKSAMTGELNTLISTKVLVKSKRKGIKMKGYFYGKPDWLLTEGEWRQANEPKIPELSPRLW